MNQEKNVIKRPAYRTVYHELKKEIQDEKFPAGTLLPPEPELEKIYSVSRTTVRRAVEILMQEGFVEVKQGRGTMVLDRAFHQNLNSVTSVSGTLLAKGYKVESSMIHLDRIPADTVTATRLKVEPGSDLYRLQRVQTADGEPIAFMTNLVAGDRFEGLEKLYNSSPSFYSVLEKNYNIKIDASVDSIGAVKSDFQVAGLLGIECGSPLLEMTRVAFSGDYPVSVDIALIRADKYRFEVDLKGLGENRSS